MKAEYKNKLKFVKTPKQMCIIIFVSDFYLRNYPTISTKKLKVSFRTKKESSEKLKILFLSTYLNWCPPIVNLAPFTYPLKNKYEFIFIVP